MNTNDKRTIVIYRSTEYSNLYFISEEFVRKFHIGVKYRELGLDGYYYAIPTKTAISIYNNSKNKDSMYRIKFEDAPLGKAVQEVSLETAKDLLDSLSDMGVSKDKEIKTK